MIDWDNPVKVVFKNVKDKWQYDIKYNDFKIIGFGNTLEEAIKNSSKDLSKISKHHLIHYVYEGGRPVKLETGKIKDSMADDIK